MYQLGRGNEDAVDTKTRSQTRAAGLEVNVAGALLDGGAQHQVGELDDRREIDFARIHLDRAGVLDQLDRLQQIAIIEQLGVIGRRGSEGAGNAVGDRTRRRDLHDRLTSRGKRNVVLGQRGRQPRLGREVGGIRGRDHDLDVGLAQREDHVLARQALGNQAQRARLGRSEGRNLKLEMRGHVSGQLVLADATGARGLPPLSAPGPGDPQAG